jgi:hypothetical protein
MLVSVHAPGHEVAGSSVDVLSRHSNLNRGTAVYETAALPLSYVGADQE